MQFLQRLSFLTRILLPLAVLLALGIWPLPRELQTAMTAAQSKQQPKTTVLALRQILAWQPWQLQLWEKVGEQEQKAGDLDAAVSAYEEARREGALSAGGLFHLGELYLQRNQPALAGLAWQSLIARPGTAVDVFLRLSLLQRRQGDLDTALKTLQMVPKSDQNDPRVAYQLGLLLYTTHNDAAVGYLTQAGQADTSLDKRISLLKVAARSAGQSDSPAYQQMILGRALASLNEWDLAQRAFSEAIRLDPGYSEAWAFRGEARWHNKQDGWPDLVQAQELNPDSALTQALLALFWRRKGQPEKALIYLHNVAASEPKQAVWQIEIGNTLVDMGQQSLALPYFQKATELEPGNPENWRTLAQFSIAYDVEARDVGLPAARQALQLAPNEASSLDIMGWTLMNLGDLTTAERFLQQAVQKESTYAAAYLHLGQLYLQRAQTDQAFPNLSSAKALSSDDDAIHKMAVRLLQRYYGSS